MEDLPSWYEINKILQLIILTPKDGIKINNVLKQLHFPQQDLLGKEKREASSYITKDIKSSLMLWKQDNLYLFSLS